jgi:hypothetical protein
MMKTYSHIRRVALDEASAALEPSFEFQADAEAVEDALPQPDAEEATSQVTSQSDDLEAEPVEILNCPS